MSLLTKTESSTIHAFLDAMDYGVSKEWAMYAQHPEQETFHDKNALRQATKDLMALDAPRYGANQTGNTVQNIQQQPYMHHQQYSNHYEYLPNPVYQRQPTFPFLQQPGTRPHPLNTSQLLPPPRPYSQTPTTSSTSSTSSFTFPPELSRSPAPRRSSPKRSEITPAPTAVPPPKRSRTASQPAKPALLSPSQKKANHIQSEQKRRANIRRGYEALCESVPALRDAIREEEASAAMTGPPAKGKRVRGRGRADDSADKVDGRSGPRSENVVLSKTIDYMNELLADRDSLRGRLERARSILPPGHPARTPLQAEPLWEREWKGGEGHAEEDAEEDEDDSS